MPMHGDELIFVYGTLRHGGSHHRLMAEALLLGDWISGPQYDLLDMGAYPALMRETGSPQ